MVTFVAIANFLVTAFNFYLAWKLCKLRRAIAKSADALALAERKTHNVLSRAPDFVLHGQQGTDCLRERYQHLQRQLQQARQLLALLLLLPNLGRWGTQFQKSRGLSAARTPLRPRQSNRL